MGGTGRGGARGMTDTAAPMGAIGGYVPMVDGPEKVTGAAL